MYSERTRGDCFRSVLGRRERLKRPLVDDLVDGLQDHAVLFERLGDISEAAQESDGALEEARELFVGYEVAEVGAVGGSQDKHVAELPVRRCNVSEMPPSRSVDLDTVFSRSERAYAWAVPNMLVTMSRLWMPSKATVLHMAAWTQMAAERKISNWPGSVSGVRGGAMLPCCRSRLG